MKVVRFSPLASISPDSISSYAQNMIDVTKYYFALSNTPLPQLNSGNNAYTGFTDSFPTLISDALTWMTDLLNKFTNVPNSISDFNASFNNTCVNNLIPAINILKTSTDDTARAAAKLSLQNGLDMLLEAVQDRDNHLLNLVNDFKNFEATIATDFNTLAGGINTINSIVSVDSKIIADLQTTIDAIKSKIKSFEALNYSATALDGVAVVLGSVAGVLTLIPEPTGTKLAAGILMVVSLVLATGSVAMQIAADANLSALNQQLVDQQAGLTEDQKDVACLNLLLNHLNAEFQMQGTVTGSLTSLQTMWNNFNADVNSLISALNTSETDYNNSNWDALLTDIKQACLDWKTIADSADNISEINIQYDTDVQKITLSPQTSQVA